MKKNSGVALAVDVVVVLIFCAIGRTSHAEGLTIGGLASTAWPFLSGLGVGWGITYALYRDKFDPYLVIPTGVLVWLSTVIVGMLLRAVGNQGVQLSFVIVASIFTGLFLIGWRYLVRVLDRGSLRR